MQEIYRVFEFSNGVLYQLVFISSLKSTLEYLQSSKKYNKNAFYFAERIKIEN